MENREEVMASLKSRFGAVETSEFRGQWRVWFSVDSLYAALQYLKEELGFDLLVDITCVDYLRLRGATGRFGLVYLLARSLTGERLTVRCLLNEPDPRAPSVTPLWAGADWLEREVWDMFGIRFDGHPDLRRILLPEEFAAHPLRKDYPLQGRGERHHFPVIERGRA
jgi:NADH-quinone oxidoreductase subunit C